MNEYSKRVKEIRKLAKMSQGDIAFEIGMSHAGFANIDRGARKPSTDQLKAINAAIKPVIGDRLIYLITGQMQEEYTSNNPISDNTIDKAKCLDALDKWLIDMKQSHTIRFKISSSDLVSQFSAKIN